MPSGLVSAPPIAHHAIQQDLALQYPATLLQRPPARLHTLRIKHIYTALVAADFAMPRVLNSERGAAARHLSLFSSVDPPFRVAAIGRAVRRIKHAAVPPELTETAHSVAFSAFPYGPEKRTICMRDACPCGSGADETCLHTYRDCDRSFQLWEHVFKQWRELTGEGLVKASEARIVIFGDRSCIWSDESDQSEFAGLEEPFAIIHKATLHVIKLERDRDAAPRPKPRRTAAQLYRSVQHLAERIMHMRWHAARAARHRDEGACLTRFARLWFANGFAVPRGDKPPRLILFMSEEVRARWRAQPSASARQFRTQRYAPPKVLPSGAVSIFTDGSAEPRTKTNHLPPAGFGFVAARGGEGSDHRGGERIYEMCGPVSGATPFVKTTTNNVAELIAFTRALTWALVDPRAVAATMIVLRYDSQYAAMIACGAWRAKKHKELAADAQRAWKRLRLARCDRACMRHVAAHSDIEMNERADALANMGRRGVSRDGTPGTDPVIIAD